MAVLAFVHSERITMKHASRKEMNKRTVESLKSRFNNPLKGLQTPHFTNRDDIANTQNAQYTVELKIGSNGETFAVVADTGSSSIWVYSSWCYFSACCYNHDTFHCEKSNTCHWQENKFKISYGSGSVSGTLANDSCYIGSVGIEKCGMGLVSSAHAMAFLFGHLAGIVGFGLEALDRDVGTGLFLDYAEVQDFAFWVRDEDNTSQLVMNEPNGGAKDCAWQKHTVLKTLINGKEKWGYWTIQGESLKVNSVQIETDNKYMIDSGTSLITVTKETMTKLSKELDATPGMGGILTINDCGNKKISDLPDLTWKIGGHEYTLTADDYLIDKDNCMVGIQVMEGPDFDILGDVFMRKFGVLFHYTKEVTETDYPSISFCPTRKDLDPETSESVREAIKL